MASKIVTVEGLQALDAVLKELDKKVSSKFARRAVAKGMQPIRKLAVQNAPMAEKPHRYYKKKGGQAQFIIPGNLKRNIIIVRQKKTDLTAESSVAPRFKGGKAPGDPYMEAIYAEHGTVNQPASPFMRPAYDSGKIAAVDEVKASLKNDINSLGKKV